MVDVDARGGEVPPADAVDRSQFGEAVEQLAVLDGDAEPVDSDVLDSSARCTFVAAPRMIGVA